MLSTPVASRFLRHAAGRSMAVQSLYRPCAGLLRTTIAETARTSQVPANQLVAFFSAPAKQQLAGILNREFVEEKENDSTAMPPDLSDLKDIIAGEWKIVDDGAMTRLYRTIEGGGKVQISFHCQDIVEVADEYDEVEEADEEPASPFRFTVTASKAGKSLVLGCVAQDATARIQSVAISSEDVESIQNSAGVNDIGYQGPEFSELSEDLQHAFHLYMHEELRVGEDLAAFIAMYADYREQCEYVKFLEDARNLVR